MIWNKYAVTAVSIGVVFGGFPFINCQQNDMTTEMVSMHELGLVPHSVASPKTVVGLTESICDR